MDEVWADVQQRVDMNSDWMPDCPTIKCFSSKDGKKRIYIFARNRVDIEAILLAAGLPNEGIREGTWYMGYERIVKEHEYKKLKKVFP